MKREYHQQLRIEFDRQIENLTQKGYPNIACVKAEEFFKRVEPLKEKLGELLPSETDTRQSHHIPFIIVIKHALVAAESAMPLVEIKGKKGSVAMHPVEPESFEPIEGLQIPNDVAYLLIDIDTGQETLNVTPNDALKIFQQENRFPLTIDEGIALVTHFPEVLTDKKKYNCFSMPGSRRGDQRVPALWISYKKPRLGWCWQNNPHTWLGSASCASRVGYQTNRLAI
jgi:hypothetical protein